MNPIISINSYASKAGLQFCLSYAKFKQLKLRDESITKNTEPELTTAWLVRVRDKQDKEAFRALYRALSPRLNAYLIRRGQSTEKAEDILQNVFASVWQKAFQFDETRANASAWIYQIARNSMIDHIRKDKLPEPEVLETHTISAQDQFELSSEIESLQKAIRKLSADQRQVIERAYLSELSHSEIQADLGLPLGTIKSRIRLGISRLKHELKALR